MPMARLPKALAVPPLFSPGLGDLPHQAEALIEQARLFSARRRTAARQALRLFPDCVEVYLLLAESDRSPFSALAFYRLAVAAGERTLGPAIFQRKVGYFWGLLETRPYMCARAGLAQTLLEL